MRTQFNHLYRLLALITTFWLLGMPPVSGLAKSSYYLSQQAPRSSAQYPIPEASKPCTADEAKWWQNLREASRDAVAARVESDGLMRRLSAGYRKGQTISAAEYALIKKKQEEEQAKLNADIESSTKRFIGLLREGKEKSYSVPIPDGRPMFLYTGRPNYTEEARQKKIEGKVDLRLSLEADGTVGEVQIVKGLGEGLDEQAIESMRQTLFLPAIRNGVFVQSRMGAYAEFNLR